MKIVQIHNKYIDLGGEDVVVQREKELLTSNGHEVIQFFVSNADLKTFGDKINTALNLPFSFKYKKKVKRFLELNQPQVVHVHNFLPILTPSIFYACHELKIPVVATLHNYRLLCVNGLLYRDKKVCEDCVSKKIPINGVAHGCYQNSKVASIFPAISNGLHNYLNTWEEKIDKIIFLTEFSRSVFERSAVHLTKSKTVIKPNFVKDRGYKLHKEDYYLFVGRLSEEKGIPTILKAFQKSGKKLLIAGEGPLKNKIQETAKTHKNIILKGFIEQDQLIDIYKNAKAFLFASNWYEGMPLVILEAFSFGTPIITPDFGNGGALVEEGKNGMKFTANDATSLINAIEKFEISDKESFCREARKTFEDNFSEEQNLRLLISIYEGVILENTLKNRALEK